MSDLVGTVAKIDAQTLKYAPAVIAGVQAAQAAVNASGSDKKQAVLGAIIAGAKAGEQVPEDHVQAIAGMIDLFVSIFKALGVFKHK